MSRRIDIELTSSLGDGTWTWRAAGAKQPKGVLSESILGSGARVGDVLKADIEQGIDGVSVLAVMQPKDKQERPLLALLPSDKPFQAVVEQRASRDRDDRPRRPRDGADRPRGPRPEGDRPRGPRPEGDRGSRDDRRGDGGRRGPSFTPPPELPQRPKPNRLRPGKANRTALLASLPEEQRAIAELALQGMGAVRTRVREENAKAAAEDRALMPEASVVKMAEEMLPKLRVAEWLDRAEAAQRQLDRLDLRDLRSVVVAASDPSVARDESTRALAAELKSALTTKQEQELVLWFGDIDAALAVGRVIRALRLSSQPPKAGVPFPTEISHRLADSTNASLSPLDAADRWSATLEAAAFSPVRLLIKPIRKPDVISEELLATVKRLAPAMPQVAALFEVEVDPKTPMPKPMRPDFPARRGKGDESPAAGKPRPDRKDAPRKDSKPAEVVVEAHVANEPTDSAQPPVADDSTVAETVHTPATDVAHDTPATDTATADTPTTDTDTADTPRTDVADDTPTTDTDAATGDTRTTDTDTATGDTPTTDVADDTPATDTDAATGDAPATDTDTAIADVRPTHAPATDTAAGTDDASATVTADAPVTNDDPIADDS